MSKSAILIASDLSARSDRHTERGIRVAEDLGCEPVIVHVVAGRLAGDDRERALITRQLVCDFGPQAHDWKLVVGEGDVPKTVAGAADIRDSKLLVVGVARFNHLMDFVLGTSVDYLVRQSSVPVLVVKQRAHNVYRRLAVATDFSDCSVGALKTALALFPEAQIDLIHTFHVSSGGFVNAESVAAEMSVEAREGMEKFLVQAAPGETDKQRIKPHSIEGSLEGVIGGWVSEDKCDLLVLGTHGRSGLVHAAIGSTASRLLETVPVDILMVRKGC